LPNDARPVHHAVAVLSLAFTSLLTAGAAHSDDISAKAAEAPFLSENAVAMDRMMAGMDVKPSGDLNRDFVAAMAPHHQGAIDMAQTYLRYGTNEQLRRIAQEIIVDQQQEIAAMNLAIGAPLPAAAPAPTQAAPQAATMAPAMPPTMADGMAAHPQHAMTNQ
jgi:hypothetical protein